MFTQRSRMRRVAATAGTLMLALTGVLGVGTAASAATVGPDQPDAPSNGTLTINLYEGETGQNAGDLAGNGGLSGIEFTVQQVGVKSGSTCTPIDLKDASQWEGLDALFATAPAAPADPYCATTVDVDVTKSGTVEFNLPVGEYFVQETGHGDNNVVSEVPNFYVSIPTSDGTSGAGWNYNVVANPKNQLMGEPTKVISDRPADLTIGSTVGFTITIPVPTLNNNETFTEAVVNDKLDGRLSLVAGSSTIKVGGTTLVEGTHYTVASDASWTLNEAGRKVLDANMGGTMTLTFDTTVLSVGDGAVPNTDYSTTFNGTKVPGSSDTYSYWGQLGINKTDDSDTPNPLEGAEFQVFELTADTCPATVPATGAVATGTSNASGDVIWNESGSALQGLWVSNVNGGPAADTQTKDYCVYETVVPAGHTAVAVDNPVTITAGEDNANVFTVVNAKTEGPNLPLTGAQGTLLMTVGGILLVVLGGGGMLIARRKNN